MFVLSACRTVDLRGTVFQLQVDSNKFHHVLFFLGFLFRCLEGFHNI